MSVVGLYVFFAYHILSHFFEMHYIYSTILSGKCCEYQTATSGRCGSCGHCSWHVLLQMQSMLQFWGITRCGCDAEMRPPSKLVADCWWNKSDIFWYFWGWLNLITWWDKLPSKRSMRKMIICHFVMLLLEGTASFPVQLIFVIYTYIYCIYI